MIRTACIKFFEYTNTPFAKADNLRDASIEDNGTWREALTARALFIAQAIVSVVTIPLALLALIFVPALALCVEDKEMAIGLLKYLGSMNLLNIALIPASLISAFVPHSLEWNAPIKQVFNCYTNCLGLRQQ